MRTLNKKTYISLLIALSLIMYVVESSLPPLIIGVAGARLGLSNIFVLYALYALGWQSAIWVLLIKSFLGPLLVGAPTAIFFSLSGGMLSLSAMSLIKQLTHDEVRLIGVSIIGAFMHNIGQIIIAMVFTKTVSIIIYFPYLALISVPCGIITGTAAGWILKLTQNIGIKNKSIKTS